MKTYWARCEVSRGQFSTEYALAIEAHNGRRFSLFADREDVHIDTAPLADQPGLGWVRVLELQREGAYSLIRLPQSTIENGQLITVRTSHLKPDGSKAEKIAS